MKNKKKENFKKFSYPVYSARLKQEVKDWLLVEQSKYKSRNLFFEELKKRYNK